MKPQLRKPKPTAASDNAVDVEAIINRGGSSPATQSAKEQEPTKIGRKSVIVYFEPEMLSKVDKATSSQVIKTSRQRWIMEAIVEKLQRDERVNSTQG